MKKALVCLIFMISTGSIQSMFLTPEIERYQTSQSVKNQKTIRDIVQSFEQSIKQNNYDTIGNLLKKDPMLLNRIPTLTSHITNLLAQNEPFDLASLPSYLAKQYAIEQRDNTLKWCDCHPNKDRFAFIATLITDVLKARPNKNDTLVYTSLGAGNLLQDYLTIRALLLAGYNSLVINIIDLGYPGDEDTKQRSGSSEYHSAISAELKGKSKKEENEHAYTTLKQQQEAIETFMVKIAAAIKEKQKKDPRRKITAPVYNWFDARRYCNAAQLPKNSADKTDILVMVDPGYKFTIMPLSLSGDKEYISRANALELIDYLLVMPANAPNYVYKKKNPLPKADIREKFMVGWSRDNVKSHSKIIEDLPSNLSPSWKTIAFVTLQDLIQCTKDNAIMYAMYANDTIGATSKIVTIKLDRNFKDVKLNDLFPNFKNYYTEV